RQRGAEARLPAMMPGPPVGRHLDFRSHQETPALSSDTHPPAPAPAGEILSHGTANHRPPHRPSAVVVLVRGHGDGLEVFWARRSDAVSYMPGFRSFVGGTLDPDDAELEVDGVPDGARRALIACALREAFEEAGV